MSEVYIIRTAHFLPNSPVSNDDLYKYIGKIGGHASKAKDIILRNNKIVTRYYAYDEQGKPTHSNALLAATAIKGLFDEQINASDIDLLTAGTSSPDQLMPSHAAMVHGFVDGMRNVEVMNASGVCCCTMHALTYAWMALKLGNYKYAVASASERLSPLLKNDFFETEFNKLRELEENGYIAFEKDFLRFMLSDGAGAFMLSTEPLKNNINFKIEWIESTSYANKLPPCMTQGCIVEENHVLKSWKDVNPEEWSQKSIFAIQQDVKVVENIVDYAMMFFVDCLKKYKLDPSSIDYFLPHVSSMYFYEKIKKGLDKMNANIKEENMFVPLPRIGNIGCASIYVMLDLLRKEKKLEDGQKVFLAVPESGRFQYSFALLTVVKN